MSRFLAGLSLVLAWVLVLGPPAAQPVQAAEPSRFCYNWDFLNNTGADATSLLARFGGIRTVGEVYVGAGNPFGAPTGSYNPKSDIYTLEFAGGPAYAGDTVHIGFCTDSPVVRRPQNAPALVWQTDAGPVAPDPLFVGIRWSWTGPSSVQVELFNDGPADVTLLTANLLDPNQALALEDLVPGVVAGLPLVDELITEPQTLPAGGAVVFGHAFAANGAAAAAGAFGTDAMESGRPLVLEVVAAAPDDLGNTVHLYVQALTPLQVYLPMVMR